jgi:hypothetical protein
MDELTQAYAIANRILECDGADPDGDEAVLARQFIRVAENAARHLTWLKTSAWAAEAREMQTQRDTWLQRLTAAIDPEGGGRRTLRLMFGWFCRSMDAKGNNMTQIALGSKVRDIVTGHEGIATSRVEYLTGCTQYGVCPRIQADGKLPESLYIDETRLEVLDDGVISHFQSQQAPTLLRAVGGDMGRETPPR